MPQDDDLSGDYQCYQQARELIREYMYESHRSVENWILTIALAGLGAIATDLVPRSPLTGTAAISLAVSLFAAMISKFVAYAQGRQWMISVEQEAQKGMQGLSERLRQSQLDADWPLVTFWLNGICAVAFLLGSILLTIPVISKGFESGKQTDHSATSASTKP